MQAIKRATPPAPREYVRNHFAKFFDHKKDEKIGVELEFPIISLSGKKWNSNIISSLNEFIVSELDFRVKKFAQNIPLSFVNPISNDVISYEVTHSTLEFSLAPQISIFQLESNFLEYFIPIQEFLLSKNVFLAATGLHPFSYHRAFAPLPDPHYLNICDFLHRYSSSTHTDYRHAATMMIGAQTHIEVPFEKIYKYLNTFHSFGWIECLLLANSPGIVNAQRYTCYRDILLRNCGFGLNPRNVKYPNQFFRNNEDYFQYFTGLSIFTKVKNGEYKNFRPVSISDLKPYPYAIKPKDLDIKLYLEDIQSCLHFNPVRITPYGTLEIRSTCQQPFSALFTPSALHRAIKYLTDDPFYLPHEKWTCQSENWRLKANLQQISFESSQNIIYRLLDHLHTALAGNRPGEEKYLEPLFKYLERQSNPALEQCKHHRTSKQLINYLLKNSTP